MREIREADIRGVVRVGLEEHLQLDYKAEVYQGNDHGQREFLLDVCMFANALGGIILIGIPERRDHRGQPSGAPDPDAQLGIVVDNPEALLAAYDASVTATIEERLPLESFPINVGGGRWVLAIRVVESTRKPHCVLFKGHIYFPSRRERHRYNLSVREIKELTMRTASRAEEAKESLRRSFTGFVRTSDAPYLLLGMTPVFSEDFLVDVKAEAVHGAIARFSRMPPELYENPVYTFDGIERREENVHDHIVKLQRNGLLSQSLRIPYQILENNRHVFGLGAIELFIRRFVNKTLEVYRVANVGPPCLLGMKLSTQAPLAGRYQGMAAFEESTAFLEPGDRLFPFAIMDLADIDRTIRPLCDLSYQTFGLEESPNFTAEGTWRGRQV